MLEGRGFPERQAGGFTTEDTEDTEVAQRKGIACHWAAANEATKFTGFFAFLCATSVSSVSSVVKIPV
jgi:hypothetical protein